MTQLARKTVYACVYLSWKAVLLSTCFIPLAIPLVKSSSFLPAPVECHLSGLSFFVFPSPCLDYVLRCSSTARFIIQHHVVFPTGKSFKYGDRSTVRKKINVFYWSTRFGSSDGTLIIRQIELNTKKSFVVQLGLRQTQALISTYYIIPQRRVSLKKLYEGSLWFECLSFTLSYYLFQLTIPEGTHYTYCDGRADGWAGGRTGGRAYFF